MQKGTKPIKLNAATILREGARVQKQEEEEDKRFPFLPSSLHLVLMITFFFYHSLRLASLEAGQRDASDYIKWQEEMKQRAAAEKLADIERKHLVNTKCRLAFIIISLVIHYVLCRTRSVIDWMAVCEWLKDIVFLYIFPCTFKLISPAVS